MFNDDVLTSRDTLPLFPNLTDRSETRATVETEGADYLRTIPLEKRRLAGQVYTPVHLVEFILDQAGYVSTRSLERERFLDPACGAGVFLLAAAARIARRLTTSGANLATTRGRTKLLGAIEGAVFGVDVDPDACAIARENVRTLLVRICGQPLPSRYFETNVVEADYLLSDALPQKDYTLIAGNPPYVAATRLLADYKRKLQGKFTTAHGRLDLYTLFIERSVFALAERGVLAFITPNKFLVSESSKLLRQLLLREGGIKTLVNFRSHKVFEDAATVPCIMVFERKVPTANVTLLECDEHKKSASVTIHRSSTLHAEDLRRGDTWEPISPALQALARRVRGAHASLSQFARRISAGFATGLDSLYVIPGSASRSVEPALRRPAVRGRDVHAYVIDDPALEIVIPYKYEAGSPPQLVALDAYPKALAYLGRERRTLERRHCVRVWEKAWYDIHDPVPMDLAAEPKILVPDLASSNRFAFDPGRFCPLHSAYYILPQGIDPVYLTAVLNSTPIEFLMRLLAPVAKDGFSRYRKQFLMPLPIPNVPPKTQARVRAFVEKKDYAGAEALVVKAFDLSREDLEAIDEFLASVALDAAGGRRFGK